MVSRARPARIGFIKQLLLLLLLMMMMMAVVVVDVVFVVVVVVVVRWISHTVAEHPTRTAEDPASKAQYCLAE